MPQLASLVFIGGLLHFAILTASACVPLKLNWRDELASLPALIRHLFWVYGGYVVLMIVGLGALATAFPDELASGRPFSRAVAGGIAAFWGVRLSLQPILPVGPHLDRWYWRAGYHLLTIAFIYLTAIFALAALAPANWFAPR